MPDDRPDPVEVVVEAGVPVLMEVFGCDRATAWNALYPPHGALGPMFAALRSRGLLPEPVEEVCPTCGATGPDSVDRDFDSGMLEAACGDEWHDRFEPVEGEAYDTFLHARYVTVDGREARLPAQEFKGLLQALHRLQRVEGEADPHSRDWEDGYQTCLGERMGEAERLREALETIRERCGAVCGNYELCSHPACQSSYEAWALSSAALSRRLAQEDPS